MKRSQLSVLGMAGHTACAVADGAQGMAAVTGGKTNPGWRGGGEDVRYRRLSAAPGMQLICDAEDLDALNERRRAGVTRCRRAGPGGETTFICQAVQEIVDTAARASRAADPVYQFLTSVYTATPQDVKREFAP